MNIRETLYEVRGGESVEELAALVRAGTHLLVLDSPQHVVTVMRLTYGRARINVAPGGSYAFYEDNW